MDKAFPAYPVLIKAKYAIPEQQGQRVRRRRLEKELDAGLQSRLIVATSPAGYGKTTAVSGWAARCGLPCCWLSLDFRDNSPERFFAYLAASLRTFRRNSGFQGTRLPDSFGAADAAEAVALLIDGFCPSGGGHVLILDNLEQIRNPKVIESIDLLIQYMPPDFHVVLCSRSAPPFPVEKFLLDGRLFELDADDFRLSPGETAEFLASLGLPPSRASAEKLADRTEGWAAGLKMIALGIRKNGMDAVLDGRTDDAHLDAYFSNEVMSALPEDLREFLVKTSVLNDFSAGLCRDVAEISDAEDRIRRLLDSNAFIFRVKDSAGWFRYHGLFGRYLRRRFQMDDAGSRACRQIKAAGWLDAAGFTVEAVRHYLDGGSYEEAADTLSRCAVHMLGSGASAQLETLFRRLPRRLIEENPLLCVARAWAGLLENNPGAASEWIAQAQKTGTGRVPDNAPCVFPCDIFIIKAYLACGSGNTEEIERNFDAAERSRLPKGSFMRSVVFYNREANLISGFLGCYGNLRICDKIMQTPVPQKLMDFCSGENQSYCYISDAEFYYEQNRLSLVTGNLIKGLLRAGYAANSGAFVPGIIDLAMVHRAKGDLARAIETVEQGKCNSLAANSRYWYSKLTAFKVLLELESGSTENADAWLRDSRFTIYDALSPENEFEHLVLVRILIYRGFLSEAKLLLESLLFYAESRERRRSRIQILILLSIVCYQSGEIASSMKNLRLALDSGEKNGYLRIFLDEGKQMTELLREYSKACIPAGPGSPDAEYVRKLSLLLKKDPVAQKIGALSGGSAPQADRLTKKELQVLRLLAREMDNAQISEALSLKLSTVKNHTSSIYAKLAVRNRYQAVAKAKELGVLRF